MSFDPRARFANRLAELAKLVRGGKPDDLDRAAAELERIAGTAR